MESFLWVLAIVVALAALFLSIPSSSDDDDSFSGSDD
ncbi:hypothetical protein LCGC14_1067570 [marine sediment metagenome]|uniref:Uncharacterized protein n=1 Tax=marine sediment metagenome TaxID=412755 RepID=A0A0F9N6C2_9ZZZZ